MQKYILAKKIPVNFENFCVWVIKFKILNFYFGKQFFLIMSCSISHMYDINYVILQNSDTHSGYDTPDFRRGLENFEVVYFSGAELF